MVQFAFTACQTILFFTVHCIAVQSNFSSSMSSDTDRGFSCWKHIAKTNVQINIPFILLDWILNQALFNSLKHIRKHTLMTNKNATFMNYHIPWNWYRYWIESALCWCKWWTVVFSEIVFFGWAADSFYLSRYCLPFALRRRRWTIISNTLCQFIWSHV